MKIIKLYEDFRTETVELKKILSELTKLLVSYGLDNQNYYDGKYETEFYNSKNNYLFAIVMSVSYDNEIILKFKISLANNFEISNFIPSYLKSIDGISSRNDKVYTLSGPGEEEVFVIKRSSDYIIKQFNLEDFKEKFELYQNTKKYNL
jgi:hypothetical protein